MVTQFGMSEKLGLATFEQRQSAFLNSPFTEKKPFSERTAELIDREIQSLLDNGLKTAVESVELNREFVDRGAECAAGTTPVSPEVDEDRLV